MNMQLSGLIVAKSRWKKIVNDAGHRNKGFQHMDPQKLAKGNATAEPNLDDETVPL